MVCLANLCQVTSKQGATSAKDTNLIATGTFQNYKKTNRILYSCMECVLRTRQEGGGISAGAKFAC